MLISQNLKPFFSKLRSLFTFVLKSIRLSIETNWIFWVLSVSFFILYVFLLSPYIPSSDKEILNSQFFFSTGRPSHTLTVLLSGILYPFPVGPPYFKFLIFNILVYSIFLYHFGKLTEELSNSRLSAALAVTGTGLSLPAIYSFNHAGTLPLTLLTAIILLRLPPPDFKKPENLFLSSFLLGLGAVSLHPVFRFLIPPFVMVWLLSVKYKPEVFFFSLFFFTAGAGILIFIPASLDRNPYFWTNIHNLSDLHYAVTRKFSAGYRHSVMSTETFVWGKDLIKLLGLIFDNIPVMLIPPAFLVFFTKIDKTKSKKILIFAGMAAAELLYYAWMRPQIPEDSAWGIFIFPFLWLAAVLTLNSLIKNSPKTTTFVFTVLTGILLLIPAFIIFKTNVETISNSSTGDIALDLSVLQAEKSRKIRISFDNLNKINIASFGCLNFPQNTDTSLFSEKENPIFPVYIPLKTSSGKIITAPAGFNAETSRGFKISGLITAEHRLSTKHPSRQETLKLIKYYVMLASISPVLRSYASECLSSWGETFYSYNLIRTASEFAFFAGKIMPENAAVTVLSSKTDMWTGNFFESEDKISKILKNRGYIYKTHLINCLNLYGETACGYIPLNEKNKILQKAENSCKKATLLFPSDFKPVLLLSKIYALKGEKEKAERFYKKAERFAGLDKKTSEKYKIYKEFEDFNLKTEVLCKYSDVKFP